MHTLNRLDTNLAASSPMKSPISLCERRKAGCRRAVRGDEHSDSGGILLHMRRGGGRWRLLCIHTCGGMMYALRHEVTMKPEKRARAE